MWKGEDRAQRRGFRARRGVKPDDGLWDADRAAERERAHTEEVKNQPEIKALRERALAEPHQPSIAEQWTAPLPKPGEQPSPEQQAHEDAIAAQAAAEIDAMKEGLWRRARTAGCNRETFEAEIWPTHRAEMIERRMQQSDDASREMADRIRNWM